MTLLSAIIETPTTASMIRLALLVACDIEIWSFFFLVNALCRDHDDDEF